MSYILEALEKSEQERKQRAVPDLQTQHTLYPGMTRTRSRRQSRLFRHLWPAVILVAIVVAAGWLYRDYLPVALEIKVTRYSEPSAGTPSQEATIADGQQIQPQPARQVSEDGASQHMVPDQTAAGETGEALTAHRAEESEASAEYISATSYAVETARDLTSSGRTEVLLQPAPILLPESDDDAAAAITEGIPFLEDLPAAIRKDLPKLKFAGHTYSAIAKNRLIIINSGIKREGDVIEPDLQLEEITWEGVILNFRGVRFQVNTTSS